MLDALSIPEREYARVPRYGGWPSQSKEKVGTEGTVFTPRLINRSHAADGICADRRSCVSARNVVAVLCSSCTQRADACAALGERGPSRVSDSLVHRVARRWANQMRSLGKSSSSILNSTHERQAKGMGWDGMGHMMRRPWWWACVLAQATTHARTHGTVGCSALTGACLLDSSLIRGERGREVRDSRYTGRDERSCLRCCSEQGGPAD
jgi:hypothetical protein